MSEELDRFRATLESITLWADAAPAPSVRRALLRLASRSLTLRLVEPPHRRRGPSLIARPRFAALAPRIWGLTHGFL